MRPVFALVWPKRPLVLALALAMAGCAPQRAEDRIGLAPDVPVSKYANAELAELLRFAAQLGRFTSAERAAESERLLEFYRNDRGLGVRLHLLLARAWPEFRAKAGSVAGIDPAEIADERLISFLAYHQAMLGRLERETERRKTLERRIARVLDKETHTHRLLKSRESELKSLRHKLDALKAIERSLDAPNDGQ